MKNGIVVFLFLVTCILAGCSDKKKAPQPSLTIEKSEDTDSTVYGKCAEGTAMHTLELIKNNGDTVSFSLESSVGSADVQGGLQVGDSMAVVCGIDSDGVTTARKVINLTSLLGRWNSIEKAFEICPGGTVVSNVKEPKPYTAWRIFNGRLVLSADTFEISFLGADSLYLNRADGTYRYWRLDTKSDARQLGIKK